MSVSPGRENKISYLPDENLTEACLGRHFRHDFHKGGSYTSLIGFAAASRARVPGIHRLCGGEWSAHVGHPLVVVDGVGRGSGMDDRGGAANRVIEGLLDSL